MSFPSRKIRTSKSVNRGTLQPSVRDFSDQVIGRYAGDENLQISTISRSQSEGSFFTRPYSPFSRSIVTYTTLESAAQSHLPATFNTPRACTVYPEEVHRRHVAKSARLRSRLSGNKQLRHMDSATSGLPNAWQESHQGFYATYRPGSGRESISPSSDGPSHFVGHKRSRPSTTGRYFNSSNGLCATSMARPSSYRTRNRPHTASSWMGPGLMIQKMSITPRDQGLIKGFLN